MTKQVTSVFQLSPEPTPIPHEPDSIRLRRGRLAKVSEAILTEARKIKARKAHRAWQQLQLLFGETDDPIHTFN